MKKLLSVAVAIAMCLSLGIPAYALEVSSNEALQETVSELKYDLSLDEEEKWFSAKNSVAVADAFEAVGSDIYVPANAQVMSQLNRPDKNSVDYLLDGVRYIVSYYPNGLITKSAKAIGGEMIYYLENSNSEIKQYDLSNNESESTDATASTYASRKYVFPCLYTDVVGTQPFNKRLAMTGIIDIPALTALGYSSGQRYYIYETMDYFELEDVGYRRFSINDAVDAVALFWDVLTTTAEEWLTNAGIVYSLAGKLQEACDPVDMASYTYRGGKEVGIFDPTYHNAVVEVVEYWSAGRVNMISRYINGAYRDYSWGVTAESSALQLNNVELRAEAQEIYNGNVQLSGWWRYGKGTFGA